MTSNAGASITKNLELTEEIPWIQQPTLGFKSFVLSNEEQFCFYGVLYENPFRKFLARRAVKQMHTVLYRYEALKRPDSDLLLKTRDL